MRPIDFSMLMYVTCYTSVQQIESREITNDAGVYRVDNFQIFGTQELSENIRTCKFWIAQKFRHY